MEFRFGPGAVCIKTILTNFSISFGKARIEKSLKKKVFPGLLFHKQGI